MGKKIFGLLVPLLLLNNSCISSVGKASTYVDIPGKATIKEIKAVSNSNCADSVSVLFDFKPDDAAALNSYRFPNISDSNVDIYTNEHPSKVWVDRKGIKVGNVYNAKRSESVSGTATPVVFTILDSSVYRSYDPGTNASYEDICK
jgi:hypothetical protein